MSNQGKDHRSHPQPARPVSALPTPPAAPPSQPPAPAAQQPPLPPGQRPTIGELTRLAPPKAEPAGDAKTASLAEPASSGADQTEKPTAQPLPGDIVWYWEGVNRGDGALRPINAILDHEGDPGRWNLSLVRFGHSTVSQRTGARFADKPESGCWTLRKPEFLTGPIRKYTNPHRLALERIKAEKTRRKAE